MTKKSASEKEVTEAPTIEYNNRTILSYTKKGLEDKIPHISSAPEARIRNFISKVDLTKGLERKITLMTRLKARDLDSPSGKKELKEFIVYREEWIGKNWLGETLRNDENVEGVYTEVETTPEIKFNNETGRSEVVGEKVSGSHLKYYIPFSKEKVDEIIEKSDSDKSEITFHVTSPPCRDYFTYDEFVNFSWEQLEEILFTDGGAKMARAERARLKGSKLLTANNTLAFKPS